MHMPIKTPLFRDAGQPLLIRVLYITAIILCLNMIAGSYLFNVLLPFLEAAYLVFAMFLFGFIIKSFIEKPGKETKPIDFVASTALGLIFTTLFFFVVSMLKILSPVTIIVYYLLPLFILLFIMKKKSFKPAPDPGLNTGTGSINSRDSIKISLLNCLNAFLKRPTYEYIIFIFPLIYAALPTSFYDSLAYHLGIPNLYLQNGGFIPTPQLFYANTFIYYEIALIPAVFAGDLVPSLFHFFIGVLTILAVIDFAVEYFQITKRYILALVIIAMPMTIFLLTAIKNDLISPVFILLGIYYYNQKTPKQIFISAIFWGFSFGVKYTNIIPLLLFLILTCIRDKRIPVKQLVVFGLIITVILVPLAVKNFIFTGNPVFPFFHNLFENKIQYWDASRFSLMEQDTKKLFTSFKDVLKFPYSISFEELGSGGVVGPFFLMFLPFLIIKREKRLLLLFFAILTLLIGANFKLSTRIWYIVFLILSIYVTIAYEFVCKKWAEAHIKRRIIVIIFFIITGINLVGAFGLSEYLYLSYNLYAGKMSVEEYKGFMFPSSKAYTFVNEKLPPGTRVLVAGEAQGYYLKQPYNISSGYDYSILMKYLEKSNSPTEFISALKQDGFEYIILNLFEFNRLQQGYKILPENKYRKALEYLQVLGPVFRDDKDMVYVLIL